jgi:nucleoside-diphosphate-sugar epimerase
MEGDVRCAEAAAAACAGCEAVFHVAGAAGIWGPWENYYSVNTLGTRNVISGCIRHGVSRLVYTSSPSVTFDGSEQRGVNESAGYAKKWLCCYPRSKALAEQDVLRGNGRGGLLTCALRPHLIWGPGDRQLIPRLLERARRGRLRRVGRGANQIDMVYVENAAEAHLQAADALQPGSPVCGRAYFISQGQPVNCWRWIDEILSLAGLPPVKKSISFAAAWWLGAVMETLYAALRSSSEPPMTRFLAAQLAMDHYFDIRRAQEDFGYSPQVSTEEGMRRLGQELALRKGG